MASPPALPRREGAGERWGMLNVDCYFLILIAALLLIRLS